MDSVFITTRKQRVIRELRDYMLIALGMLMYAIGWTVFLLPNDLPSGAVPGIASIVYWATGLPVQYTYLGINGVLLILSLVILGWKFSVKTIYAVFVLTSILPIIQDLTGYTAEHLARLLFIAVVKPVVPLEGLRLMFSIQEECYPLQTAYDYFCDEFENMLGAAFGVAPAVDVPAVAQIILC